MRSSKTLNHDSWFTSSVRTEAAPSDQSSVSGGSQNASAEFQAGLRSLFDAWEDLQDSRHRDAVYNYLGAVFRFVRKRSWHGKINKRLRKGMKAAGVRDIDDIEIFSKLIELTSDPDEIDAKTRSKWSRVLRYAIRFKKLGSFKQFVLHRGGLNGCARLYAERLGRGSKGRN